MENFKEFISKAVPQIDHPVLNSLHNASTVPIVVPVTLYKGDVEVFSARVSMIGTCLPQYNVALYALTQALNCGDVDLDWDKCCFLAASPLRERAALEEVADDDLLLKNIKQDCGKSLNAIFRAAHDELAFIGCQDGVPIRCAVDNYAARIAAGLVRDTVTLISSDLDDALALQPIYKRAKRHIASIFR